MTNPEALLLILFGAVCGGFVTYYATWKHARKVEDLVPGGLRKWDDYDAPNAQAKGQAKGQLHDFRSSER